MLISPYLRSWQKRALDLSLMLISLPVSVPLLILIGIGVGLTEGWPIFFIQPRIGKDGKIFKIVKFRTMKPAADQEQEKYRHLNEADGPVFKIKNDPRFMGFGKWLARTGLDELPQIVNVLKGEMSFIGPRPLPIKEAQKLSASQRTREQILPGIISWWAVNGAHKMTFNDWMKSDRQYLAEAFIGDDMIIIRKIVIVMLRSWVK
jgi:lipopolysaccharide/colanic/teichoic acid biosynthesis glycosyltransferase